MKMHHAVIFVLVLLVLWFLFEKNAKSGPGTSTIPGVGM